MSSITPQKTPVPPITPRRTSQPGVTFGRTRAGSGAHNTSTNALNTDSLTQLASTNHNVLSRSSVSRFSSPSRRKEEEDTSYGRDEVVQGSGFRLYTEYNGHRSHVKGCTFNSTNQTIATLDEKGVCLWEKGIEHLRFTFPPHSYNSITAIQFDPHTNAYYAASLDWSIKTFSSTFVLAESVPSGQRTVLCLVFNSKRSELISGAVGTIQVWTVERRQPNVNPDVDEVNSKLTSRALLKTVEPGLWIESIHLCQYDPNKFFAVHGTGFSVYDSEKLELTDHWPNLHSQAITGVIFYEPSHYYITSSKDCSIRIWEYFTKTPLHSFNGHAKGVTGILLHPSPHLLVSCSFDCTIRLWDLDLHEEVEDYRLNQIQGIWGMSRLSQSRFIAFCADVTRVFEFNYVVASFAITRSPVMHLERVQRENQPSRILALCQDSSVRLFKPTTGLPTCIAMIDANHERVDACLYSPNLRLLVLLHVGGAISHWSTTEVHCPLLEMWTTPSRDTVLCVDLCHGRLPPIVFGSDQEPTEGDCDFLAGGTDDGWLEVWTLGRDSGQGVPYTRFEAHKHPVVNVCYLKTLHYLLTISSSRQLIVWDLREFEPVHHFYCHPRPQVLKAGRSSILMGHFDGKVSIFDCAPNRNPAREANDTHGGSDHAHAVTAADYLDELDMFLTCSLDGLVKLWRRPKELIRDMSTSQGLLAISFLNSKGDFVVGIRNNVSVTRAGTYLPKPFQLERSTSPVSPPAGSSKPSRSMRKNASHRRSRYSSGVLDGSLSRRTTGHRLSRTTTVVKRSLFGSSNLNPEGVLKQAYGDLQIFPRTPSPEESYSDSDESVSEIGSGSDLDEIAEIGGKFQAPRVVEKDLSLPPIPEWKKRGDKYTPGSSGNPTDIYNLDVDERELAGLVQGFKEEDKQKYIDEHRGEADEEEVEGKVKQVRHRVRREVKRQQMFTIAERIVEDEERERASKQFQPDTSASKIQYKDTDSPKANLYFRLPPIREPVAALRGEPAVDDIPPIDSEATLTPFEDTTPSDAGQMKTLGAANDDILTESYAALLRIEREQKEKEEEEAKDRLLSRRVASTAKKKKKGKKMSRPKPGAMQPITSRAQQFHTHAHSINEVCARCDPRNKRSPRRPPSKKQPVFRPSGSVSYS